ncbi:MAG TPA: tripartite tricarboxylate transporter TctB family protein [Caldimonas sp.]|nr:tripartite tricarboxylate transporter TctB family protein [Caldimonas sp.]
MRPLRRFNKDRVSGTLLVLLGAGIVAQGLQYRMGTLTRMGAGFVPVVLGTLLALVGVAVFVTAEPGDFGTAEKHPTEWRGWICILGAVVAFVVIGEYGGLVPATLTTVFLAAMGDRENSVRDAALLSVGVTLAGVLIFIYGLKMIFPLFAWGH